jgi:glycosyltransferase involved in cell wall biosynthesis
MVVLYEYLGAFEREGWQVLHVVPFREKWIAREAADAYAVGAAKGGREVIVFPVRGWTEHRRHAWSAFRPEPFPEDIAARIRAFDADVAFCFDIAAAGMVRCLNAGIPLVTWLGDLNFETVWYHALYAAREQWRKVWGLPKAAFTAWRWKQYYAEILRDAASVVSAADIQVRHLARLGIRATYLPFPWPSVVPSMEWQPPPEPTFAFMGNMAGLGSRSALHFLFDGVIPHLRRTWGDGGFSLLVCGREKLPPWADECIRRTPEIQYLGFIEDLTTLVLHCHAMLVPIAVPIGNRTRIVATMAMGVPLVAHSNTALGNPALKDGETCYLASDPASFAERMGRIVERPEEARAIIKNARRVYEEQFHPDRANARFIAEIKCVVGGR